MGRKSIVRINLPLSENTLALTSFAMNFRLCSSEYNSPLYSMDLPVSKVAVCSLLKPAARHNLSRLIMSLICGNHFKVLFNNAVRVSEKPADGFNGYAVRQKYGRGVRVPRCGDIKQ